MSPIQAQRQRSRLPPEEGVVAFLVNCLVRMKERQIELSADKRKEAEESAGRKRSEEKANGGVRANRAKYSAACIMRM